MIRISRLTAAEWGKECFDSVCAQIRLTVEAETGQRWVWRPAFPLDVYELVREGANE